MEEAIKNFNTYLKKFDKNDYNINLKIEHTFRVVELAEELAKRLNLNAEDTETCLKIALLHDIGRFYQLEKFHSFSDFLCDHATCGVEYLFDEGHIREYNANPLYDEIIKKAIYYHNRYVLDIPETGRVRMFINFIRDIDKIDIFYVMPVMLSLEFNQNDVTNEELMALKNKLTLKNHKNLNKSEDFLMKSAFIYEFNFPESLEILQEKGYLDLFFAGVKVSEDSIETFKAIKEQTYAELNKRLEEKREGDRKYVRKKI